MENLITEHIDIWTSAQTEKTNGIGRGNHSAKHGLHGIKKLRELILELAVCGKLVPQDPNDDPASVLLEKIAKEKVRLIKEGKIKKQETLPEITDDEKAFVLPAKWEWARFSDMYFFQEGPGIRNWQFRKEGIKLLNVQNIVNGKLALDNTDKYIDVAEYEQKYLHFTIEEGDLLFASSGGSWGKTAFFSDPGYKVIVNTSTVRIHPHLRECSQLYMRHFVDSQLFKNQMVLQLVGMQPNFGSSHLLKVIMPVPPSNEQRRIACKVDELMTICDQLDQQQTDSNAAHQTLVETLLATITNAANQGEFVEAWQRIANHFDILFTTEQSIDQLKQTILQLAVMGKLVHQDPTDEPASVLLEKIAKEKARLIKEGKIKKQEPLPEISEDEKPFELPNKWLWVRLGVVLTKITDGTHHSPPNCENGEFLYISAKNIKHEGVLLSNATYVTIDIHNEIYSRCDPEYGDILYIKDGATTGITTINNLKEPFSMLSSVALLKVPLKILNTYLLLSLRAPYFYEEMRSEMTGVAITRVTLTKLNEACISLPPLAEQHRIVAKVDELMALCDTLKAWLKEAQTTQIQLADAIVEQAVS